MRWALRAFALFSTALGFYYAFNLHEYAPIRRRLVDGIFWTSIAHTGLWLSTFDIRGYARYLVVLLLIPSSIAVPSLMWGFHITFAIVAFGLHIWLIVHVIKQEWIHD